MPLDFVRTQLVTMTFITPSTSPKSTATATTTTPLYAAEERVEGHGRPYDGRPLRKGRGAFIVLEGIDRCGKTTQCALLLKHLLSLSIATTAMRFPNRTTAIGQMINSYLSGASGNSGGIAAAGGPELTDQGVHLLFSANRWECMPNLVKALGEGTNVICDRYAYSGVAFTSAKIERESSVGTNKPDSSARSSVLLTNVGGADGECDKGKPHSRNNQGNGDSDGQEDSLLSLSWCMGPDIGLPAPDAVIFLDVPQDVAERRGG